MNNIVVLTPNKKIVRLKSGNLELENKYFDISGLLSEFTVGSTRYIFIDANSYLPDDRKKVEYLVVGFVEFNAYNEYFGSQQGYHNFAYFIKPEFWFDLSLLEPKIGDLFKIEKLETSPDTVTGTNNYTKYYVRNQREFRITNLNIDFSDSSQYPPIDTNFNSPNYSVNKYDDKSFALQGTAASNFFSKNLGSKISSLPSNIEDEAKKVLYLGMIKICWRIKLIFLDVLEKLMLEAKIRLFSINLS